MKAPDDEYTDRIAFGLVLVASIVSSLASHLAFVIATRSAPAGAPGVMVTVAVFVTLNHVAVMVAVVVALTADVVTGNAALAAPPLTTASLGTWTTAGLLLDSWTVAPFVAPLKVTAPVPELARVTLDGLTDTDDRDGPAGVALTDRFAVRETFLMADDQHPNEAQSGMHALMPAGTRIL